jgi:Mce-associated membrane protein
VTAGDDRPIDVLAELAEAEAAEADALAEAERAKAKAAELRNAGQEIPDTPDSGRSRVLSWRIGALAAAAVLIGAGLTLTALMLWKHAEVAAGQAQDRASIEAARDGVMALLSIDHTRAKEDVQRVLDLSTGRFREDFARDADDFVKTAIDSQAVTKGSVRVAALQSVKENSGVVLVAASSKVTNASGAKEDTRPWRMRVTVTRDGDIWKMSDVEFVP